MTWRLALSWLLLTSFPLFAAEPCESCHLETHRQFAATAMAKAARSDDFIQEWGQGGRNPACLSCHAPSGTEGVVCVDCHGLGPHPYPRLSVPETCARCHDAPGESTVRRHKTSLAARRNLNCLSCHVKPSAGSHGFIGATDPAFLRTAALLHLAVRNDLGKQILVAAIRPRTGHALPGGTTGRSVWLVIKGMGRGNAERWRETWRFGWWQGPKGEWEDATLAPDIGANLEVAEPGRQGTDWIEAELIFRFRPGPFEEPDPRQVTISKAQMTLRR
ncbi:exported hypothetical protein [Rhodospirillaceae bacterium LM-1]|nr:exported hypothetical protein [Rhodospirillaceae bacterium LM-1]